MNARASRGRPGVTLIELLVVVAIIGVLAVLLLVAVQSARESARRATCLDNLRQVGLALHGHAETHQALPGFYNGSFLDRRRRAIDEFHFLSWRTAILPRVEQAAAFDALNFQLPATVPANQTAVNVRVGLFVCQTSPRREPAVPELSAWNGGAFAVGVVGPAAGSDYEAVGGVQVVRQTRISTDLGHFRFGPWGEPTYDTSNGEVLRDRVARLADVTDGLAHTILVGERAGRPDIHARGRPVERYPYRDPAAGGEPHQAAWAVSTHFNWLVSGLDQGVNESNQSGIFAFHPGGANVAMADGSARFLKESTSPAVLRAMITRAGGEVVEPD